MQLALDHPAKLAGAHRLPFLLVIDDGPADGDAPHTAFPAPADNRNAPPPPLIALPPPAPPAADYAQLYDEERQRADQLEQRLTSAVVLLHETAAERDRWYGQAQRALSLIDGLQRQLAASRRPRPAPKRRRRRFFGLF